MPKLRVFDALAEDVEEIKRRLGLAPRLTHAIVVPFFGLLRRIPRLDHALVLRHRRAVAVVEPRELEDRAFRRNRPLLIQRGPFVSAER